MTEPKKYENRNNSHQRRHKNIFEVMMHLTGSIKDRLIQNMYNGNIVDPEGQMTSYFGTLAALTALFLIKMTDISAPSKPSTPDMRMIF
ncbi:hypothetical protein C7475_101981 [Chitinophaga sp. S165]|nr:hypothetical protein C7475_101981 [Chitinophaga sp. S165]